jgi:hypothetical protein
MLLEGETSARVRALRGYEDFTDAVATGAVSFDIHENAILAKIIGERRSARSRPLLGGQGRARFLHRQTPPLCRVAVRARGGRDPQMARFG